MIRVTCQNCKSQLDAKESLLGETRKCPKCGEQVVIQPSEDDLLVGEGEPASAASSPPTLAELEEPIELPPHPKRLSGRNKYLICSRDKVFATWDNDGQGWQIHEGSGFVSAKRNTELLPNQGNFVLIELVIDSSDEGNHLVGMRFFQLAEHWALPALGRGDHAILDKITGPGTLSRERKVATLGHIRGCYMHEFFARAKPVLDFLTDNDYHAHSAGTVTQSEEHEE